MRTSSAIALLLSMGILAGCETPPTDGGSTYSTGTEQQGDGMYDGSGVEQQGYQNGQYADDGYDGGYIADNVRDRVFFGLDSSVIDSDAQSTLKKQALWLQQNPDVAVLLEGHCDERGTREYNLALGARRAEAAKSYLVSLGVDPMRMRTVSYGKERPAALGSNEEAWAKNRRAVTVIAQ